MAERRQAQIDVAIEGYDPHYGSRRRYLIRHNLTEDDIREIYRRTRELRRALADEYGVSESLIRDIRRGRSFAWITGAYVSEGRLCR